MSRSIPSQGSSFFVFRMLAAAALFALPGSAQERLEVRASQAAGDQLGAALASAGDVDGDGACDLVIGAPQPNVAQPGYALVVSGRDGHTLRRFEGEVDGERFGVAVAGGEDVDGDGRPDVAIGASGWKRLDTGERSGRVLVASAHDGRTIRECATPEDARGVVFGLSVLLLGDVNGDGRSELAIAAPSDQITSDSGPGRVYVYDGASGEVLHDLRGKHPRDGFGHAIALAGDLDGDGAPNLFVAAPGDHAPDELQDYVRAVSGRTGATLFELQGEFRRESFGAALAGGADFDGDGRPDVAVGCGLGSENPPDGVRVFSGATREALLRLPIEAVSGRPGYALAFLGDLDGDGSSELLVARSRGGDALTILSRASAPRVLPFPQRTGLTVRACALGDVDDDRVPDFAVSSHMAQLTPLGASGGYVAVLSGRTGLPIFELRGSKAPSDEDQSGAPDAGRSNTSSK